MNRVQGQVVAEELGSFEGGDVLFFSCGYTERKVRRVNIMASWVPVGEPSEKEMRKDVSKKGGLIANPGKLERSGLLKCDARYI